MSDIRFEGWLHRSGTGGVYQDSAGNVGIASTQPQTRLDIGNGGFQVGPTGIATVTTVNTTNLINATPLSHRNIIINGAMQVAQRGTSSTSSGYQVIDRFPVFLNGADENPTIAQGSIGSSDSGPYEEGFRTALTITNGNQTGGAGSNDYVWIQNKIEAQDIAKSGWNYTSTSSYITLSFWVKSSVAQDFKGYIETIDGTAMQYPFATGSLTQNTWTKITKSIPGHANLTFNNDNGEGFKVSIIPMMGTDKTSSSVTEDAWGTYTSSARIKDVTTTWYTTNDATFELTGVQLEVGSQATAFEHRSYSEELSLCQRYYQRFADSATGGNYLGIGCNYSTSQSYMFIRFLTEMRTAPSIDQTNISSSYVIYDSANQSGVTFAQFSGFAGESTRGTGLYKGSLSTTAGLASIFQVVNGTGSYLAASAEL